MYSFEIERGVFQRFAQNREGNIIVALRSVVRMEQTCRVGEKMTYECKPREDQVEQLIQHFHMYPKLPQEAM